MRDSHSAVSRARCFCIPEELAVLGAEAALAEQEVLADAAEQVASAALGETMGPLGLLWFSTARCTHELAWQDFSSVERVFSPRDAAHGDVR